MNYFFGGGGGGGGGLAARISDFLLQRTQRVNSFYKESKSNKTRASEQGLTFTPG